MSQQRRYTDNAERQRAYRERKRNAGQAPQQDALPGVAPTPTPDELPDGYAVSRPIPGWWYVTDRRCWGAYCETRQEAVTAAWAHRNGGARD